jgi:hypothetical protein
MIRCAHGLPLYFYRGKALPAIIIHQQNGYEQKERVNGIAGTRRHTFLKQAQFRLNWLNATKLPALPAEISLLLLVQLVPCAKNI